MNKYEKGILLIEYLRYHKDLQLFAKGLVERATPIKPIGGELCSVCNHQFMLKSNFCPDCGKATDWGN